MQGKAELERYEGRLDEAVKCYQESHDLARAIGCRLELAHTYLGWAEVARLAGQ